MARETESGAEFRVDRSSVAVRGSIVALVVTGVSATAALVATTLIIRRWFTVAEPLELPAARLRLAGFLVAGFALAIHWSWRSGADDAGMSSPLAARGSGSRFAICLRHAAVWLALVYLVGFCHSVADGLRVVGPAAAVELAFAWGWRARGARVRGARENRTNDIAADARRASRPLESAEPAVDVSGRLSQSALRGVDDEGEFAEGEVRLEFAAGERSATTHVSFCPPLETAPRVTATRWRGAAASVTVGQAEIFGARFDVRLDRISDQPQTVVIRYVARSAPASREVP